MASAELDHDSPSARKASTAACGSSTGGANTTISRARSGVSVKPCFVAFTSASVRSASRSRPISTRSRARWDSSACFERKARARSVFLGASAGPGFGKRASEREQDRACRERDHQAGVAHDIAAGVHHQASDAKVLRPPQAEEGVPRRSRSGVPRSSSSREMRFRPPPSARECRPRVQPARPRSAARAAFVCRRRIAMPATTSSCAALDAGGSDAGSSSASMRSASSRRPIRAGGALPDCAHARRSTRSPCASSVARAASSVFVGQPRSRETRAISASATTQLARATASFGPKARAAAQSAFARTRSPNWAIAMPRSASAGASSRNAMRFSAPSGSPAASARAAAVISESTESRHTCHSQRSTAVGNLSRDSRERSERR